MRKMTARTRTFAIAAVAATLSVAGLSACSDNTPDEVPMAAEETVASETYADTAMAYDTMSAYDEMSTMTATAATMP